MTSGPWGAAPHRAQRRVCLSFSPPLPLSLFSLEKPRLNCVRRSPPLAGGLASPPSPGCDPRHPSPRSLHARGAALPRTSGQSVAAGPEGGQGRSAARGTAHRGPPESARSPGSSRCHRVGARLQPRRPHSPVPSGSPLHAKRLHSQGHASPARRSRPGGRPDRQRARTSTKVFCSNRLTFSSSGSHAGERRPIRRVLTEPRACGAHSAWSHRGRASPAVPPPFCVVSSSAVGSPSEGSLA